MKTEALLTPHMLATLTPRTKEYTLHDAGCPGLALRVQPSGARSWVTWQRRGGKTKRITLGALADLSLPEARAAMQQPARHMGNGLTFGTLAARFLAAKDGIYQPDTLRSLGHYLTSQLLPAFGPRPLLSLTTPDLTTWFHSYSRTRPGGANQALGHFTTLLNWGKEQGLIPPDLPNPAAPLRKNRRRARGQMLNSDDLSRLFDVLRTPPQRCDVAAKVVELILLTGCRSGEILRLHWDEVGPDRLTLRHTKTGPRTVLLSPAAASALRKLQGKREGYVFPRALDPNTPLRTFDTAWRHIKRAANLPTTLRLHDLRHTYASHAILSGETLLMSGHLLGHAHAKSTERYAHLDSSALELAAHQIGIRIAEMLGAGQEVGN